MTVISVCVPTLVSPQEKINYFYDDLRTILINADRNGKLVLLGGLNTCVGLDSKLWSSIGCHGMGKCNANELLLLYFYQQLNPMIVNSWFRQQNKYNATLKHPYSGH